MDKVQVHDGGSPFPSNANVVESSATPRASTAQAANALEALAGHGAFLLFACEIVGTGSLGVPVLAVGCVSHPGKHASGV
jgi:hypothetical protein